ncbi:MAG: hypothetical protein JST59_00500 [Actinobacteria bacterium]|nr:hypothetical protein [Actinomycetota bacterium]
MSCPEVGKVSVTRFLISNFAPSSIINIVFGMLFGILLSEGESYRYLYGQWRYRDPNRRWLNRLLRVALELIPALISAVILYWFVPRRIVNVYWRFFVQGLGAWITGFFLIVFTHNLMMRSQVIVHNRREEGAIRDYYDF